MERFFLSLKTERVWQRDYANHAEAVEAKVSFTAPNLAQRM